MTQKTIKFNYSRAETIGANGNRVQQCVVTESLGFPALVKCGGFIRPADSAVLINHGTFVRCYNLYRTLVRCEKIFIFFRHPVHKSSELWVSNCFAV